MSRLTKKILVYLEIFAGSSQDQFVALHESTVGDQRDIDEAFSVEHLKTFEVERILGIPEWSHFDWFYES